ncbi:hypothetical protein V6Z12_D11G052700 [Gossypium hirsutum]
MVYLPQSILNPLPSRTLSKIDQGWFISRYYLRTFDR